MENEKKKSFLSAVLLEVSIIAVLVIGILVTLNYFRIIPLSATFPYFSFLPAQNAIQLNTSNPSQPSSVSEQSGTAESVLLASQKKIDNPGTKYLYASLNRSKISVAGTITLKGNFGISVEESTNISGIIFSNGLDYIDDDYKNLSLFYFPKGKNWTLEYRAKGKSEYFPLIGGRQKDNGITFSMSVDNEGKTLSISLSDLVDNKVKTIHLPSSLYENGREMTIFSQVAPGSELNIYGLRYELTK